SRCSSDTRGMDHTIKRTFLLDNRTGRTDAVKKKNEGPFCLVEVVMARPTGARLIAGLVLGIVAVQALMLFAFAWPASNSGPREVPVAVAGPPEVADRIEQGLAAV